MKHSVPKKKLFKYTFHAKRECKGARLRRQHGGIIRTDEPANISSQDLASGEFTGRANDALYAIGASAPFRASAASCTSFSTLRVQTRSTGRACASSHHTYRVAAPAAR